MRFSSMQHRDKNVDFNYSRSYLFAFQDSEILKRKSQNYFLQKWGNHSGEGMISEAYLCKMFLKYHKNGKYELLTQENEIISDDMIVEFSYDILNKDNVEDIHFLWKPLRIRYDKTEEYRIQKTVFGNDYGVANSNWYYINNPITDEMIRTGENIPAIDNNDD